MNQKTKEFNAEFAKIKSQILVRDNWDCMNTVVNLRHWGTLDVDHIRKRSLGGKNELKWLITLCRGCHSYFEDLSNHEKEKLLTTILKQEYKYEY